MKILKNIGLGLLGLIVLILILAVFIHKDYSVTRSVIINKNQSEVFNYVKYLKNQNEYSKWAKLDPNMQKNFSGTDATVGFISSWKGNSDVGEGEQEITAISPEKRIDYEIRFIEPFASTSDASITLAPVADSSTKVDWTFTGKMDYPMNIMFLFMNIEESIASDLDTGLSNLKNILEK